MLPDITDTAGALGNHLTADLEVGYGHHGKLHLAWAGHTDIQPAQELGFRRGEPFDRDLKVKVFRVRLGPFGANPSGILFRVPAVTMPGITDALARFAPGHAIAFHQ